MMTKESWGRWGSEDQAGSLNLIGSDQVRAALATVRRGQVISLAQPLGSATPTPPRRNDIVHFMDRDGGDYAAGARRPGGFQFAEDTLLLPLHSGTHIDALSHVWYDDELYNGHPANAVRSTTGAGRCGVEQMSPIVTRGVLLDAVNHLGRAMRLGETISAEHLDEICGRADVDIGCGDAVLLRTGWDEQASSLGPDSFAGEPGIDEPAALWLAERDVAVIGADNFAVECIPFPEGQVFPVHQRLIRDYGIPLIEGLHLQDLAAANVTTFLLVAAPLPIVGGTGSPLHPCAVV